MILQVIIMKLISQKLKTFAHREYSSEKFSSIDVIKKKIFNYQDLFNREM